MWSCGLIILVQRLIVMMLMVVISHAWPYMSCWGVMRCWQLNLPAEIDTMITNDVKQSQQH